MKIVKDFTSMIIVPVQQGINKVGNWTDSKLENINEIMDLENLGFISWN